MPSPTTPAVPFVITAGEVEVRALGTAFSVRRESDEVKVRVTEGRVSVGKSSSDLAPKKFLDLEAQPEVVIPKVVTPQSTLKSERLSAAEMTAALAWRGKRVEFTDTPLAKRWSYSITAITFSSQLSLLNSEIARSPEYSGRMIRIGLCVCSNPP